MLMKSMDSLRNIFRTRTYHSSIDTIYRLEMAFRASYLASDREIDLWAWIDMGLLRHKLTELVIWFEEDIARLKYVVGTEDES